MKIKLGTRVQHRAWYWRGTVVALPEGNITSFSPLKVKIDDGRIQTWAPTSLITDIDEFVYDWSDEDGTIERRPKSKSKKPKHKR